MIDTIQSHPFILYLFAFYPHLLFCFLWVLYLLHPKACPTTCPRRCGDGLKRRWCGCRRWFNVSLLNSEGQVSAMPGNSGQARPAIRQVILPHRQQLTLLLLLTSSSKYDIITVFIFLACHLYLDKLSQTSCHGLSPLERPFWAGGQQVRKTNQNFVENTVWTLMSNEHRWKLKSYPLVRCASKWGEDHWAGLIGRSSPVWPIMFPAGPKTDVTVSFCDDR